MRPEIVFEDGLGPRYRWSAASPEYAGVEMHLLRASLAGAPAFEFALRERVSRLSKFHHPSFPTVHGVERGQGRPPELLLFSDASAGMRLSVLLEDAYTSGIPLDCDAALCILRQLVDAVAALHAFSLDVAHGALSIERLHIAAPDRLLVVDHALGSALQQLRYPSAQYWSELGVATPSQPQPPVFDQRLDVVQIGALGVALLRGYPLDIGEWQGDLAEALSSTRASAPDGTTIPLPPGIRGWLARALQLNPLYAFSSAVDAKAALDALLDERGSADHLQLTAFLSRCFGELEPFWTPGAEYPRPLTQAETAPPTEPELWSDRLSDVDDGAAPEGVEPAAEPSAPSVEASTIAASAQTTDRPATPDVAPDDAQSLSVASAAETSGTREAEHAESPDERPRIEPPDVDPPQVEPPVIVPPDVDPDEDLPRIEPPVEAPPVEEPPAEEPPPADSSIEPSVDAALAERVSATERTASERLEAEQSATPMAAAPADSSQVAMPAAEPQQAETQQTATPQTATKQPPTAESVNDAAEPHVLIAAEPPMDAAANADAPTPVSADDAQVAEAAAVSVAPDADAAASDIAAYEAAKPRAETNGGSPPADAASREDLRLSLLDLGVREVNARKKGPAFVDMSLVDLDRVSPRAAADAPRTSDRFDVREALDGEFRARVGRDERIRLPEATASLPEPDLLGIDARLAGSPIEITVRTNIEQVAPVRRRVPWLGGFLGLFCVGAASGVVFAWNEPVNVKPPALGMLRLTSAPAGIDAYVNNAYRGLTPLDIVLPPGAHLIELRGETERRLQIVVSPGLTLAQFVDLPNSGRPVTMEHAAKGTMSELVVPGAMLDGDGFIEPDDSARAVAESTSTN